MVRPDAGGRAADIFTFHFARRHVPPRLTNRRQECHTRELPPVKIFLKIILVVLIFMALSSGATKVALMQQDVDFFGQYGFSNPILIVYGLAQILGGVLMISSKTRLVGSAIVAITFLISLVVLLLDGNIPVSIATVIATVLLGVLMKHGLKAPVPSSS